MNKTTFNFSDHRVRAWFIRQSLDHPGRTIIISLLVTVMMGFGLRWFVIEDDIMKMLPADIESRVAWDKVREEFGNTDMIFLAFGNKGESVFSSKTLADLWKVTRALEEIPEVDEVITITTQNRIDNVDGILEVNDLQPDADLSEQEVEEIRTYLDKNPKLKLRFVGRQGDFVNMAIRPVIGVGNNVITEKVVSVGEALLKDYEIHFGGTLYITGSIPKLIRDDVAMLMRTGVLIMVVILLVNLRSPAAVGMIFSVILLSLIAMAGFMGWMIRLTGSDKFLFTMLNTSMPIILLTIANSDGVHVLAKFFRVLRKERNVRLSLERTMDSLLMPIFLTSLTTIVAFMSMSLAPMEQLIGYGFSMAVGITWAWFLSSTFLPAIMSLKKWKLDSKAVTHASLFERLIDHLGKQVLSHPRFVLSSGILVVVIAAFGITQLKINVNIADFFKEGTEIKESMQFMDDEMTGTMDIQFKLEGDLKSPKTLESVNSIQTFVETYPFISTTFSIVDVIKQMHKTVMDDDPAFEIIPDTRGKVNNLFTMYSMSGDPEDFESLVDYDYENGLVTALGRNISSEQIVRTVNEIETFVSENVGDELKVNITGMIVVFRDLIFMVVKSSFISIFASLFLIVAVISYFFRRILWGFLAVVPLSAAVILNFGLMGLFGMDLSHITAILSSIIIGVGVDFSIHYVSQYRRMVKRGVSADILSREVVDEVGYPIILDAASNMGFGALLFSAFLPIQYIGGLMVFAMLSTSLGTLTLLAALIELIKRRLIKKM